MVQIHELELAVGDVFRVGERTVTVMDIDHGEVTFRIDDGESHDDDPLIEIEIEDKIPGPLPR